MYFLLILTILVYTKGAQILITLAFCIWTYYLIIFSVTESKLTPPRFLQPWRLGSAEDGENYYEVTTNPQDTQIEGCYEKMAYYNVHSQAAGRKYPVYRQTGGQIHLRIDEERDKRAPWVFADEQNIVLYE